MSQIQYTQGYRIIIFRGRRTDTGEMIEGNYFYNTRKGELHAIIDREHNNTHEIYRESLQLQDWDGEFKDV